MFQHVEPHLQNWDLIIMIIIIISLLYKLLYIKPLFVQLLSVLSRVPYNGLVQCNYSTVNFTKKKKTLKFKRTEVRN